MPTPSQLAKSGTEHGEQVALFAWCGMATSRGVAAADDEASYTVKGHAETHYGSAGAIPALHWFHAIPNGGSRGDDSKSRAIRGGQLKAEGQRNGVFDTFWPHPRGGFAGLYIEMKKSSLKPKREGSAGGLSDEQIAFGNFAHAQGYCVRVAYTWREAVEIIKWYLTL